MSTQAESSAPAEAVEKKEVVEGGFVEVDETEEKTAKPTAAKVSELLTGEVALWKRTHGFLLYKDDEKDVKIFCHGSQIKTDDKKVLLRRGMECQFKVETLSNGKTNAIEVQAIGGGPLNFHQKYGEKDTYDRKLLYSDAFFEGEIKFFSRLRGYGRILMNEEGIEKLKALNVSEEELENVKDLYFKEVDLDVVDFPAKIDKFDKVQFQVFNSSRGYGGIHIRGENGEPIPIFTKQDREAKRALKKERDRLEREEKKKDDQPKKGRDRKRDRKNRKEEKKNKKENLREEKKDSREEKKVEKKAAPKRSYADVDTEKRWGGTVSAFSVHRFGFIKLNDEDEGKIQEFGNLKNKKLCFRVQDIETEQRPPMVDADTKVKFSINRMENGTLYATRVRNENDEQIVCDTDYKLPQPRKLLESDEWCEGTVLFYNWRRGHGRVQIEGAESEFYFHRDDLKSNDKVPGIAADFKVMCQKVDDPKGSAVTNICNLDKTNLENQLPHQNKKKRNSEKEEETA